MSGLGLRADPERWEMWYRDELNWWKDHAPDVLGWLRSSDVLDRKRAIAVVSQRHLRRHELATHLLPLLHDVDDSVAAQAARALSLLNSRLAVPALKEALAHPSADVRESILAALRSLGVEVPDEA